MYKLGQVAVLSGAMSSIAVPASAESVGFSIGVGYVPENNATYDITVPTQALTNNTQLLSSGLLPANLHFSMSQGEGIHGSIQWRSKKIDTGAVTLTYGASVSGTYYNDAYVDANFNEAIESHLISRIINEANQAFRNYNETLGIDPSVSREIFYRAATTLVREPNIVRPLNRQELIDLIPHNISTEMRTRIIEQAIPALTQASQAFYDSDVMRGLRKLSDSDLNFSGAAMSISLNANAFARATLDQDIVSPYVQAEIGYQTTGFLTKNNDGGGFHGPTASLQIGLSGDFNNGSWDLFVDKPFGFEQKGPEGLTTHTPDDISIGLELNNETSFGAFGYGASYTPETKTTGININLNF